MDGVECRAVTVHSKLSIIIPVFNEAGTIEAVVSRVLAVPFPISREIIIVDDGSFDGTRDVLMRMGHTEQVQLVLHDRNKGKGAAVRSGLCHASGDIFVVQDADLELRPEELPRLLEPILAGDAQVCYGSRFLAGVHANVRRLPTYWANRILNALCNRLNNLQLTDFNTCYKMITKSAMSRIDVNEAGFAMEAELTTKLSRLGYGIVERPIDYLPRTKAQGKKITAAHFFLYVVALFRYRFFWPGEPIAEYLAVDQSAS